MDPHGPSSFTDLLNSQGDSDERFFHTNVGLGSISVPRFTNQLSEPAMVCEGVVVRRERRKWTPKDDIVLCSSWLNTSKYAVVGNEQKHHTFWTRVCNYFNASSNRDGVADRELIQCKMRWQKINEAVSKFVGCFALANRQVTSGQNEADVLKVAYEMYFQDNKKKFNMEHCWLELKNDQKWCDIQCDDSSNKRKLDDSGSSYNVGESEPIQGRPAGVKAAKRKAKQDATKEDSLGSQSSSVKQFEGLWSIRKEEIAAKKEETAAKERMCNKKILDSLLNKTEPLTPSEITLKDKLINDLIYNVV